MSKVRLSGTQMSQFWDAATDMYIVPAQILQDAVSISTAQPYTQVFEKPLSGLLKISTGEPMPAVGEKVNYGRLVRIPSGKGEIGMAAFYDVTVKDAKAEAKRLRKLARQIEKACR